MNILGRIEKNKGIVKKPVKRAVFDFDDSNNSKKRSEGISSINRDVTMSPESSGAGEIAIYKTVNQGSPPEDKSSDGPYPKKQKRGSMMQRPIENTRRDLPLL